MKRASATFPPYFVAVALTSALISGAFVGAQALMTSQDSEQDGSASVVTKSVKASVSVEDIRVPVDYTRTFDFQKLSHDVTVEGSLYKRKRIRKRLRTFRDTMIELEASGQEAGFYLTDLGTQASVSYAADEDFYPASSIKGPYVACVYECLVDTGKLKAEQVDALASAIITYSDNDAYHALRELCGSEVFATWAVECGALEEGSETFDQYASAYYPRTTPRQLARMWEHLFAYFDDQEGSGPKLAELFEQRVESPLRAGLNDEYLTLSKAGWYPADAGEAYMATADAGIVLDGEHAYVMVVMTTIPDDLNRLAELVPAFWSTRRTLS